MVDIQRIKRYLEQHELDAVVATNPLTTCYLKNLYSTDHAIMDFANHPTFPVFPRHGDPFIIDYMSWNPPPEVRPSWIKQYYPGQGSGLLGLEKNLVELAGALHEHEFQDARIGIDLDFLPVKAFRWLQELMPGVEFVNAQALFWQLRATKSEKELGFIRRAVEASEKAFLELIESAHEGASVRELGRVFARAAFGPDTEFRWCSVLSIQTEWFEQPPSTPNVYFSPGYRLRKGDSKAVCFDMGVACEGYISDMARALYVGQAPPEIEARFEFHRTVQRIVCELLVPGMNAREVWQACHEAFKREIGDDYTSLLGLPGIPFSGLHGVGLGAHERPYVSWNEALEAHDKDVHFEVNTVFTIEPGCTEDMYVLTESGPRRLTTLPLQLYCV
jgi:Xaa-Pro dipeptidase